MSNKWTHSVCGFCWADRFGKASQAPVRVTPTQLKVCCLCGAGTKEGIYLRLDPQDPRLKCGGEHNHEPADRRAGNG